MNILKNIFTGIGLVVVGIFVMLFVLPFLDTDSELDY